MNIGIIIHSHTGNTLSVGEKLKDNLNTAGHTAQLERVVAINEDPNTREIIKLKEIPSLSKYDVIIIGAPVRGFSLSPVMMAYLSQLQTLNGKPVACFVTQHFPKPWMGGNRAIKQMKSTILQKGGTVTGSGIVNWTNKSREKQITDLIVILSRI